MDGELRALGSNNLFLTYFHNETWGGEKVYILLDKLLAEPKRYIDLLEFIYICFSLGFRGRYKIETQNSEEFELIYKKIARCNFKREKLQ